MLQFNKSLATNTNALYLDTVNTDIGYYDNLIISYSQSYDNSNGTFIVNAVSVPNVYTNWLLIENQGLDVPSYTGQYDIQVFKVGDAGAAIWGTVSDTWESVTDTWKDITGGSLVALWNNWNDTWRDTTPTWSGIQKSATSTELIYNDRAWISGSNESSITTYISANENGTYTTYNG